MTQKLNLKNKKIGYLKILEPVQSKIIIGKTYQRTQTEWQCECECGKIIIKSTQLLLHTKSPSCGCKLNINGIKLLPNQKFNRLTTVKYVRGGKWECLCECGNITKVDTRHLESGNTKSCGCLKIEKNKEATKLAKLHGPKIRKFNPEITSARRIWRSYQDNEIQHIDFDTWYKLVKLNCYYCGCQPYNKYNGFVTRTKSVSQFSIENGWFTYNGLDRLDNNKEHTIDNVVPACPICNRAKNCKNINEFNSYINNLQIKDISSLKFKNNDLPINNYLRSSIKTAYNYYIRNYKIMEINLKIFYNISQLSCFYCNAVKTSCCKAYANDKRASIQGKKECIFYYNGIDRIDSKLTHTLNNVVPCCKYCNFAKSNLSYKEFHDWIIRIKSYNEQKNQIIKYTNDKIYK